MLVSVTFATMLGACVPVATSGGGGSSATVGSVSSAGGAGGSSSASSAGSTTGEGGAASSSSSASTGGGSCGDCDDGNECTNDACNPDGWTCMHVARTNDSTCDSSGHCNPADSTCCHGVFVVDVVSQSFTCAAACPPCMCPQSPGAVCVPASGAPFVCTCP